MFPVEIFDIFIHVFSDDLKCDALLLKLTLWVCTQALLEAGMPTVRFAIVYDALLVFAGYAHYSLA